MNKSTHYLVLISGTLVDTGHKAPETLTPLVTLNVLLFFSLKSTEVITMNRTFLKVYLNDIDHCEYLMKTLGNGNKHIR